MRFYGFGNYYLSSLQQGLQAAHVIADIAASCISEDNSPEYKQFIEWADNHKTIVLLNGGNSDDLFQLFDFFDTIDNPYPFDMFNEDEASLMRAATCVGIIVPEEIYQTAEFLRYGLITKHQNNPDDFIHFEIADGCTNQKVWASFEFLKTKATNWQIELIERLNKCGLAH